MFLLKEINYRFSRMPGRSVILLLASVMLVASMGAYLGSLQASQTALDNLAESIPVTARVVNRSGTRTSRLSVEAPHFDALTSLGVRGVDGSAFSPAATRSVPFQRHTFSRPALSLEIGITLESSLGILLIYLLCASLGTALTLIQLLRFDTLSMLTKND